MDLAKLTAANLARWNAASVTLERLREVLRYEPETGHFFWLKRLSFRVQIGGKAGSIRPDGYIEIGIDGESYLAHVLAWFYVTGEWPAKQVEHKDTVKSNNAWINLREATHGQNVTNSGVRKNNTSGFKGVSFVKDVGRWHARIMSDGQLHLLGYFDSPEEAHVAYAKKAAELHGEFARVA